MTNTNEHFEKISSEITFEIYPYLIKDLKDAYKESFTDKNILEIGVGPGHLFEQVIKEDFNKAVGIDISEDMLERANKRCTKGKNQELLLASADLLPFQNESFDIVLSRGSVFFWKELDKCFNEVFRVLKNDGLAFIGGGYGLTTPEDIIAKIKEYHNSKGKNKDIPKLDPYHCAEMMNSIGGHCEVLSKKGHGFWLKWKKAR